MPYLVWGKFAGLNQKSLRLIFGDPTLVHVSGYDTLSIINQNGETCYNCLSFEAESFCPSIYLGSDSLEHEHGALTPLFEQSCHYIRLRAIYYSLVNQVFRERGNLPAGVGILESLHVDIDRAFILLKANRIQTVVFGTIPHDIFDVVVYYVARFLGNQCIVFKDSVYIYGTRIYINPLDEWPTSAYTNHIDPPSEYCASQDLSFDDIAQNIKTNTNAALKKLGFSGRNPGKDKALIKLNYSDLNKIVIDKASPGETIIAAPFSFINRIFRYPRPVILPYQAPTSSLPHPQDYSLTINSTEGDIPHHVRFSFSSSIATAPPGERYAFMTLNVQPEATTTVLGASYEDSLAFIRRALSILPKDILLYIKDHPLNSSYVSYRRHLDRWLPYATLKRVRFVNIDSSAEQWLQRSTVYMCVSGSAGMEAIGYGKPVVYGGSPEYSEFGMARHISTFFGNRICPSSEFSNWLQHHIANYSRQQSLSELDLRIFSKSHFRGYTYRNPLLRSVSNKYNSAMITHAVKFIHEF